MKRDEIKKRKRITKRYSNRLANHEKWGKRNLPSLTPVPVPKHFFLLRLPYSVTNSLSFSTHARARARVRIDDDSTYTRTQRWRKDDAKSCAAKRSTNPLPSPATLFPHQFPSLPHKRTNKESAPIGIFAKRGVERRAARRVPRGEKRKEKKKKPEKPFLSTSISDKPVQNTSSTFDCPIPPWIPFLFHLEARAKEKESRRESNRACDTDRLVVATLVNFKIAQDDSNNSLSLSLSTFSLWFFARGVSRPRARPLPGGHSSVPIWAPYILLVPGGGGWWRWSGRYIGAGVAARVGHKEPSPRRWYNSLLSLSLSVHSTDTF